MIRLFVKLLRTLYGKSDLPPPPKMKGGKFDVLLSVWNVFHSREQRRAFTGNDLSVHWVGNHYPTVRNEVSKRSFGWIPFSVFLSAFFLKTRAVGIHASMWLFDWFSGTRRLNTRLVWAYVELNTRLLRRAKKRGIPIVLDNPIAHMDDYYALKPEFEACGVPWPDWWIRRWVAAAKREYQLADWFNVGSTFVRDSLVKRGISAERIFVIPYGVDAARWRKCHDNREPKTPFAFVYTASVDPRKGIQYLLRAWKAAALDKAELWICGGTEASMDWNRVCGGLPAHVRFFGRVKHEKLEEIYAKSSVYVLPSLLEGLARSGLEAMSAGLPVVVTRETGLSDFVTDGVEGWIVPARDTDALADSLRWCVAHPDAVRKAGEAAYRRMQGRDFSNYGDRCAAIAEAIIAGKTPQAAVSRHALK